MNSLGGRSFRLWWAGSLGDGTALDFAEERLFEEKKASGTTFGEEAEWRQQPLEGFSLNPPQLRDWEEMGIARFIWFPKFRNLGLGKKPSPGRRGKAAKRAPPSPPPSPGRLPPTPTTNSPPPRSRVSTETASHPRGSFPSLEREAWGGGRRKRNTKLDSSPPPTACVQLETGSFSRVSFSSNVSPFGSPSIKAQLSHFLNDYFSCVFRPPPLHPPPQPLER